MARIDPAEFERHYAEVSYHVGRFMMEHLRRLNAEFEGDLVLCIVLGEIGQHSARRIFHQVLPASGKDAKTFLTDEVVELHRQRCNMLSVAEASGIPRETVRRKVAKLIELGFVARDPDGTLAATRKAGSHFKAFDRQTVSDLLDLAEFVRRRVGQR